MKICETCGEPIDPACTACPLCESPQAPSPASRSAGPPLRTIDVEAGLPTVAEALRRLEAQLERARTDGVRLVRVIHGWGSTTGGGGRIRAAVRRWLQEQVDCRRIRGVLFGDHVAPGEPEARDLRKRQPALATSQRTDPRNPGITCVEL